MLFAPISISQIFFPLHLKFGMSTRLERKLLEGTDYGLFTCYHPSLCLHHIPSSEYM